jgi:hypothetical protein
MGSCSLNAGTESEMNSPLIGRPRREFPKLAGPIGTVTFRIEARDAFPTPFPARGKAWRRNGHCFKLANQRVVCACCRWAPPPTPSASSRLAKRGLRRPSRDAHASYSTSCRSRGLRWWSAAKRHARMMPRQHAHTTHRFKNVKPAKGAPDERVVFENFEAKPR